MHSVEHARNERIHTGQDQSGSDPADPNHPIRMAIKLGVTLLFIVYLYVLVKVILFKFGGSSPGFYLQQLADSAAHPGRVVQRLRLASNLVPLHEITGNIRNIRNPSSFINFFGNIAAFMPLGFLLPLVFSFRSAPMLKVLVISFGVSLTLESLQLVLGIGTFDVDDMIMNTAGGMLGYIAFRVLRFIFLPDVPGRRAQQHVSGRQ
ncbi:VanZ family protein [Paenibacillus sp. HJL G12]|uniref:VanZ family protein n=1 Tax=Paenibacillus dendrobii TaxID=2691084 RepID=A0A7X3LHY3_9BACL|nr:VanZ family protein [Paenibacillus dendrobii]MWV45562.1 VanZ family protein [Paenibacillus dendrobii]